LDSVGGCPAPRFHAKTLDGEQFTNGDSKKKVQECLKEHPRKCRIVLTGDTNLAAMYAANSYPIYVVIDRD
jgi:hypothetical protein